MFVIVDFSNNLIATTKDSATRADAQAFIDSQGMHGFWFVKLKADWKGPS